MESYHQLFVKAPLENIDCQLLNFKAVYKVDDRQVTLSH